MYLFEPSPLNDCFIIQTPFFIKYSPDVKIDRGIRVFLACGCCDLSGADRLLLKAPEVHRVDSIRKEKINSPARAA
jgi:hypothetical protein